MPEEKKRGRERRDSEGSKIVIYVYICFGVKCILDWVRRKKRRQEVSNISPFFSLYAGEREGRVVIASIIIFSLRVCEGQEGGGAVIEQNPSEASRLQEVFIS